MKSVTVHIINNDLMSRLINSKCLDKYSNFEVIGIFPSLKSCYAAMEEKEADVILADIENADNSEIDMIKTIKKDYPAVKILLKAFNLNSEKLLKTLSTGISGYVSSNGSDFIKAVEAAFQGGFWMNMNIAKYIFNVDEDIAFKKTNMINKNSSLVKNLTQRELEVLKLITQGKTNLQIAKEMIVSLNTAKAHVGSILTKLSVTDRVQAAVVATKANIF